MNIHDYRINQLIINAQLSHTADVPDPTLAQLFNQLRLDLGLATVIVMLTGPERLQQVLSNNCTRPE